jgi:tetratricopeptide (TPR) repeat protein
MALGEMGKSAEAIVEFREAARHNPAWPDAYYELGNLLRDQGRLDEAIIEFREALRLKPDFAEAHCNLGSVLRRQGHFFEALVELKQGHELGSKILNWPYPSADWVRQTEEFLELDCNLPAILAGKRKPSGAAETLRFAQLCYDKKCHGASARLWSEAFQVQPKLADDMQAQHRYNAACAAALASAGQAKDDPPLGEPTKTRWRNQAVTWLKSDLKAWCKLSESTLPQARLSITKTLQHWKTDPDLTSLRDPAALAKLPKEQQKSCQALWSDVDAMLAKLAPKPSP